MKHNYSSYGEHRMMKHPTSVETFDLVNINITNVKACTVHPLGNTSVSTNIGYEYIQPMCRHVSRGKMNSSVKNVCKNMVLFWRGVPLRSCLLKCDEKNVHSPIFWLKILSKVSSSLSSRYFCITLRMLWTKGVGHYTNTHMYTHIYMVGFQLRLLLRVIPASACASPCPPTGGGLLTTQSRTMNQLVPPPRGPLTLRQRPAGPRPPEGGGPASPANASPGSV